MDKWIVHKFGGSSVADAECFRRVADIIEASPNPREAVVLSACRGVTDALLDLVALAERPEGYIPSAIEQLKRRHEKLAAELLSRAAYEAYCTHLNNDCRDIAGVLQTVRLIRSATYSMRDVIAGLRRDMVDPAVRALLARARPHPGRGAVGGRAPGRDRRMGAARPGGAMGLERTDACTSWCRRISRAGSS